MFTTAPSWSQPPLKVDPVLDFFPSVSWCFGEYGLIGEGLNPWHEMIGVVSVRNPKYNRVLLLHYSVSMAAVAAAVAAALG